MVLSRNYKLVILISAIIIASTVGIGVGYFVIQANSNNEDYTIYKTYYGNICFECRVKKICDGGCFVNDSLDINVFSSENEVIVNQILNIYCCPEITDPEYFALKMELVNNNLTIREIFNSTWVCRCICPFRIDGTISNITAGSYNLRFMWENKYLNRTGMFNVFNITI